MLIELAHIIQNHQSHLAQACCSLRSARRWAITGTPSQNKLSDFSSIVKFLQVYPYSESKVFEEEILKPWQNRLGIDTQRFLRLKTLVRAITIRRSKAVVHLPTRTDEVHHLDFAPMEREKYEAAKIHSRALLEDAISSGNESGKAFNALRLLNTLRLICSHGLLAQPSLEKNLSHISGGSFDSPSLNFTNEFLGGDLLSGRETCSSCGADILEDFLEGLPSARVDEQREMASCKTLLCEMCNSQFGNRELASTALRPSISFGYTNSGPSTPGKNGNDGLRIEYMSTKIKALIADISNHCATEKRFVSNEDLQSVLTSAQCCLFLLDLYARPCPAHAG
jgi:SWI/SNF-related matrix-associated actin-dependent regulator of chromatin subfamily A3